MDYLFIIEALFRGNNIHLIRRLEKLIDLKSKLLLDGLDGGELVGVGLDADARVETKRQQVVDDLKMKGK